MIRRNRRRSDSARTLHIAWGWRWGPASGLGLDRFGHTLLLPSMDQQCHWSLAVAGAIGSANAAGYLVGALLAAPLARRIGSRRCLMQGMVLTALALFATAAASSTPPC